MNDKARWDAKYDGRAGTVLSEPDALVAAQVAKLSPPGRALDLAAGTGRYALHLAELGWRTSAWDVSSVGLGILKQRAAALDLRIDTLCIDLLHEDPPLEAGGFDLVVCVLFLDRDLFRSLHRFVAPGGHLIFSTVTTEHPGAKPPIRYRLNPGELESGVPGFENLDLCEKNGRASLLARRSQ